MQGTRNERDEDLALFFEMRRREKENEANNNLFILPDEGNSNSDELDVHLQLESNNGNLTVSRSVSSLPLQRRSRTDEFLNSENEKSDYDWLLTPPGTPLFPSLEMESQKTVPCQEENPASRPVALRSRPANIQVEPALKSSLVSKHSNLPSEGRKPAIRRSATPTGRPLVPSTTKPSRSSTPNARPSLLSTKPVAPPVRSSTPTRSSARSSSSTARASLPASKSTSRSATPTPQPSNPLSAPAGRASSASKARPTTSKTSVPSRGTSPTVKSRPRKPSEMPGVSLDAPPKIKTSLPERPASASKVRPQVPSVKSSSVVAGYGRVRQRGYSPSRAASHSSVTSNVNLNRSMNKSRLVESDEDSPVVMGTKMVERVVNMRKLAPPKRGDDHSTLHNSSGKSSSSDSSGFGLTLSKKSLDMAIRHMDIRRSIPGNLHSLTSIPASSSHGIRTGATKSKTSSASESPLATSSNCSSQPSFNNTSLSLDGSDIEGNDLGN